MPVKPEPSSCMEEQELIYQCAGIYAEAGILLMALHEYGRIRGYKNVDYIILNLVSGHSTAENTINIIMPRVSNTTKNCVITEWKKKVGDLIEKDDILFNYENDKAAFEYRYEFDNQGVLVEVLFNEGDKVPVLEKVGVIEIV